MGLLLGFVFSIFNSLFGFIPNTTNHFLQYWSFCFHIESELFDFLQGKEFSIFVKFSMVTWLCLGLHGREELEFRHQEKVTWRLEHELVENLELMTLKNMKHGCGKCKN